MKRLTTNMRGANMKKRQSGVLMHISSLPGAYGIGSFGQSAYDFVDFLVRTKQRYWQILPLGTTSYGDSPYQSFSAFAGNTHFIDLDIWWGKVCWKEVILKVWTLVATQIKFTTLKSTMHVVPL